MDAQTFGNFDHMSVSTFSLVKWDFLILFHSFRPLGFRKITFMAVPNILKLLDFFRIYLGTISQITIQFFYYFCVSEFFAPGLDQVKLHNFIFDCWAKTNQNQLKTYCLSLKWYFCVNVIDYLM